MYTETQKEVYRMLIENTGIHFLDSGGNSGRMWQRNHGKTIDDFDAEAEEEVILHPNGEIEHYVSLFHFLSQLEIDSICEYFNRHNIGAQNWDSEYYGVSQNSIDALSNKQFFNDYEVTDSWNSYNWDCPLSQTIQGTNIIERGDRSCTSYIFLQIHGGADVRGGYTDARMFKIPDINDGRIHEYLSEYTNMYQLECDVKDGSIVPIGIQGKPLSTSTIQKYLKRS